MVAKPATLEGFASEIAIRMSRQFVSFGTGFSRQNDYLTQARSSVEKRRTVVKPHQGAPPGRLSALPREANMDGSQLITVQVREKCSRRIVRSLQLREIRARAQRPAFRVQQLRLWTSILDWNQAPAMQLVQLYAQHWEQELYFRELKLELRRSGCLQNQMLETMAQEIAPWILSGALIARERAGAALGEVAVLRVSFVKLLELLRLLWLAQAAKPFQSSPFRFIGYASGASSTMAARGWLLHLAKNVAICFESSFLAV